MCDEMNYLEHFKNYTSAHAHDKCAFSYTFIEVDGDEETRSKYEKDGVMVIFNGEIANVDELRATHGIDAGGSEAETVYKLYTAYGEGFFSKLKGSSNYVIHDFPNQRVYVSNDRFGMHPIYYSKKGDTFLFSSEVKPLLATGMMPKKLNYKGVADFFTFGFTLQHDTMIDGIDVQPPGTVLRYDLRDKSHKFITYYNIYDYREKHTLKESEVYDLITEKLDEACKRSFNTDENWGLLLTAGLDTRAMVASALKYTDHIETFTYGIPGCIDEALAKKLAKKLNTEHRFYEYDGSYLTGHAENITRMTDGMLNYFHTAGTTTYQDMRKVNPRMVSGEGGGFSRGGHQGIKNLRCNTKDELMERLYAGITRIFDLKPGFNLFNDDFFKRVVNIPKESLRCTFNKFKDFPHRETLNMYHLHERFRKFGPAGFQLKRPYLKIVYPFMDDDYIETLLKTPEHLRNNTSATHINMIKRLDPALAKWINEATMLPLDSPPFMNFIAKHVMKYKQKFEKLTKLNLSKYKPYLMFDKWLRDELKGFATDLLFSKRTQERGFYHQKNVRAMFDAHLSGQCDFSEKICGLMSFEMFMRMYID